MKNTAVLFLMIMLFACRHKNGAEKNDYESNFEQIGLKTKFMDNNIRPQDDFYHFVNGNWMKNTKIPADRSRWGSFDELRKNTDKNTLKILREAMNNSQYKSGSDERKALDYFASIMDVSHRKKQGVSPIMPFIEKINAIQTKQDVIDYMIATEPLFGSVFISIHVAPDMKDSNRNILYISPSGLGLPEREYYVSSETDAQKIRKQYQQHIAKMFRYIGKNDRSEQVQYNILNIETKLAKAKLTKEEKRNPDIVYNLMTVDELDKIMPDFDVPRFLKAFDIHLDKLIVTQPNYQKAFNNVLHSEDIDALKDYLTWSLLRSTAGQLSPEISDANWAFYGKTLEGQKERRSLEERALSTVNWSIGEAVGKIYVQKLFPPEAKQKAIEMISYLQKAYKQRIQNLTWMSNETKQKAIEKVSALRIKIGYPDKWKDFSQLTIVAPGDGGTYFKNSMAIAKWKFNKNLNKLGKPVDKTEWGMAPQIVNAYYNSSYNEIVFPAGILQSPFYDYKADEAVNYGGMGAVIGHEISHGFDDQGAKFNAAGNFDKWWTEKDFEQFNLLVTKLAKQYDKIEVLPGVFVNGTYTSGENIGDLGGVNSAYTALQLYYKDHQKPGKIQGFTPEQRFFLSWATIWRTKSREESLKKQIKTDPHSPGQVRASQPLKNIDAFYRAFDVQKGDGMYIAPNERVKIW